MKRNEKSSVGKKVLIRILKAVGICSILLVVTTFNSYHIVEGNYAIKEQPITILEEGESGGIFCIQNGYIYLGVQNASQAEEGLRSIQIVDVHQPENPKKLGKYVLDAYEILMQLEVRDNIAYLLKVKSYLGVSNWNIILLNVTDPTNPMLLGSSEVENKTRPWDFALNANYLCVGTETSLEIFDCSNPSAPVKVTNYTIATGYVHANDNYLYIVADYVSVYDLTNPVQPAFLGKVKMTKHTGAGSGVIGKYVIVAFYWFGLQVYNFTNPVQPTICGNYEFPQRETYPGGQIHAMEIQGEKLFAAGRKIYVFDISNLQDIKRITRKTMGDRDAYGIALSGNYIYATSHNTIKVFLFEENALWRNVGIGIGILLPVTVIVILRIRKQKGKT